MNKTLITLTSAVLLAGCCSVCNGPKDSGTTYIKDAIGSYVESGELPGTIVVLYNNGIQETTCLGYADVAKKRKITMDDHFMQCSQTKGFCGVTVAKLVEEGKLNLDDPVSKYLPEFKKDLWIGGTAAPTNDVPWKRMKAQTPITIRMCLNHSAGFPFELPNFQQMGGWARRMPIRSVAATAAGGLLQFEPGQGWQYSNVGIDVAAACVEVVTGMRWEDYLQKTVLDPLGMKDSGFWPSDKWLSTMVELYECHDKQPATWRAYDDSQQRPYGDDRVFASSGAGLWTTANDQLKFYKMLMNLGLGDNGVRILKEETVKNLLARSSYLKGEHTYSLGLGAPVVDGEDKWFGHGGAWGTSCEVNWHKKQLKLTVVQLTGGPRPWDPVKWKAWDKFFQETTANDVNAFTGRVK